MGYSTKLQQLGYRLPLMVCLLISLSSHTHEPTCRIGERYIIGRLEQITRIDHQFDTQLTTLIDSGATTSSMDAKAIRFEKVGNNPHWVRFNLVINPQTGREVTLLKPVRRYIRVQTHHGKPQERPVIEATIELGAIKITTEFSLISRSPFPQPVLLGKNTLEDLAVIDMSQEFLLNNCQ